MGKRIVLIMIWIATSTLVAQDITGKWSGTLIVHGNRLQLAFNIIEKENGSAIL